jgi:probable rRNA maturation factor
MDLDFFNYKKYNIEVETIKERILSILADLNLSGYIGIEFVSTEKIKKLNKKYRNINESTDVLSFSTKTLKKNQIFGEITICPEYAKKEKIEIIDLVIHGLIHLLGYDHKTKTDIKKWDEVLIKFK